MTFQDQIPFFSCNNTEFLKATANLILPENPGTNEPTQTTHHIDNNNIITDYCTCKYYSASEFLNLESNSSLNIFHNNINGLENKFDDVNDFLLSAVPKFDIIAFTETSEKYSNKGFISNVNINGYELFSVGSKSKCGGAALYLKRSVNSFMRPDLSVCTDKFEAVWAEIKNQKSKNVLCASIYRHPHNDITSFSDFIDYMEKTLSIIASENKDLYLCGDFNFDLLKLNENKKTERFFELMYSYGLFHQISIPTRVTDKTATIIDNIFTNNILCKKFSGNITTDFSDHYSQYLSIERQKFDVKENIIYKRDYTNFSRESFRDDVSIQNFNNNYTNVNDKFNDFFLKLEGAVSRHAPLKKLSPKEIRYAKKPWITPTIKRMIKIRNNIFKLKKAKPF